MRKVPVSAEAEPRSANRRTAINGAVRRRKPSKRYPITHFRQFMFMLNTLTHFRGAIKTETVRSFMACFQNQIFGENENVRVWAEGSTRGRVELRPGRACSPAPFENTPQTELQNYRN